MVFGCLPGFTGFDCSIIWLIIIALFFIAAIMRKQINDNLGQSFSLIGGTGGAVILFIAGLYIIPGNSIKWALLAGLIGLVAGGFGGGYLGLPDAQTE